jgi:hypothetical protein
MYNHTWLQIFTVKIICQSIPFYEYLYIVQTLVLAGKYEFSVYVYVNRIS